MVVIKSEDTESFCPGAVLERTVFVVRHVKSTCVFGCHILPKLP